MEIAWLEDFLAVVEYGSFSRAAEQRRMTQSALSRRIKALEDWVGVQLFARTTHSVRLTPAGEVFHAHAEDLLRRLAAGRADALEQARSGATLLKFASTHALSLTFFPAWLRRVEETLSEPANIQLVANNLEACERMMQQGQCHFLLCHRHERVATRLSPSRFRSHVVGHDELLPVSAPDPRSKRQALHRLPGTSETPVAHLAYRPESGLGRIIAAVGGTERQSAHLKPVFSSDIARLLLTMTVEGRGVSWLPRSLITDHLADGRLVPAASETYEIALDIAIMRPAARQSSSIEQFWSRIAESPT